MLILTIPGQWDWGASFWKAAFPENDLDLQLVLKDRWYGRRFLRTMYVAHPFCYHEMAITMYAVLPFQYNVLTMALNQPVRLYSLLQATLHKHHQDYPSGPYNDIWFQDSNTSSQLCRSWSGTTMRWPWTKMSGLSEKLEQKWSPF